MPHVTLQGQQQGVYSIAGITFVDGVADPDTLSRKQLEVLGDLGAEVDGSVPEPTPEAREPEDGGVAPDDPDRFPASVAGALVEAAEPSPAIGGEPEQAPQASAEQAREVPPTEGDGTLTATEEDGQGTTLPPAESQPEQPVSIAADASGAEQVTTADDGGPAAGTTQEG